MRVDTLHKKMAQDVRVVHESLAGVLPVRMPKIYETREMNVRSFLARLNKVTEPLNVFNELKEDPMEAEGTLSTSGLWNTAGELPENGSYADVRLIWHVHPKTKRVKMTPHKWNRHRFYFYQLLMHELMHRHQDDTSERVYRARSEDRETKESQTYYGATSEIEAHAHDAALELRAWWPAVPFRTAVSYAKEVMNPTPSTYMLYQVAFMDCPSHPAMKHFKRKLRAWYDLLDKQADFYDALQLPSLT